MTSRQLNRRLDQIEQDHLRAAQRAAEIYASGQRAMCCPIPEQCTQNEVDAALSLLRTWHRSLQGGVRDEASEAAGITFRNFAISLHRKYGGWAADQELS